MTDWRSLVSRMADELDHYRQLVTDDRREVHALAKEARVVLSQSEPEVVGPSELRVALQQAAHELDVAENALLCSSFHNAATRAKQAARTARAALSADGPAVPNGREPASVVDQPMSPPDLPQRPEDFEFALDFLGGPENDELRAYIERLEGIARAANLLERQAAPVPVASDVYFEFVISDADYCTQAGGIAPSYAQAVSEGQHHLAHYQKDGPHILELRRVEVLPLPSVEVAA